MEKLHFKIRKVGGLLEDSNIPELRPQYGNKENKEEQGKIITQNEIELKKYLYDNYLPETIIDSELLTFWDKVINKDDIEWLGKDGKYTRSIGGKKVTKQLFGKINV
jgi:hypothetical protein